MASSWKIAAPPCATTASLPTRPKPRWHLCRWLRAYHRAQLHQWQYGPKWGGLYLATSTATVNGNQLIGNSAGSGAGIYIQAGNPTLDNNVVAKNVSADPSRRRLYPGQFAQATPQHHRRQHRRRWQRLFITDLGAGPSTIELINNIMVDHAVGITLTAGNKVTLRSNLFNNNVQNWGGSGIVDDLGRPCQRAPRSLSTPMAMTTICKQPARRVDQAADDAGINIDYDNQARPADNGFDMGADEFVFTGIQVFIQTVPDPVVAGADFQLIVRVVNIGNIDQTANVTVTLPSADDAERCPALLMRRSTAGETWVQVIDATINSELCRHPQDHGGCDHQRQHQRKR